MMCMDLYARINVLDGRAVRLGRGSLDQVVALDADPINRARGWAEMGADRLLVVDLDAAAHRSYRNRPLIDRMLEELDTPIVVAGGVRSEIEAARLVEQGAWRVTMGTAAIETPTMVWDLCREFPERIMVSLDVLPNEELVSEGWTFDSGRFMEEVMLEMASCGVSGFLIADARRDVLAEAPNLGILRTALGYIEEPVLAAGGVRDKDDLRVLAAIEVSGRRLGGVVVGREVTEGRFTIAQAKTILRGSGAAGGGVRRVRLVISGGDSGQSLAFYRSIFGRGATATASPGPSGEGLGPLLVETGAEVVIELTESDRDAQELAVEVEDLAAFRERLIALGHIPRARPSGFEVSAPDGTVLGFSEPTGS